jgi:hypothetical protein
LVQAKGWFEWLNAFFSSLTLKGGAAAFKHSYKVSSLSFFTTLVPNNPSLPGNIGLPKLPSTHSPKITQANVIMTSCMPTAVTGYVVTELYARSDGITVPVLKSILPLKAKLL